MYQGPNYEGVKTLSLSLTEWYKMVETTKMSGITVRTTLLNRTQTSDLQFLSKSVQRSNYVGVKSLDPVLQGGTK